MSLPGNTLCFDVGGSGVKSLLLDPRGEPLDTGPRAALPRPTTPKAVIDTIVKVAKKFDHFERVSVGFPGVVVDDVVLSSASFGKHWSEVPLGRDLRVRLERIVKVANDSDLRGLGLVEGHGVELVLTLGTGMGSALFTDGRLVPNFSLGAHPFMKKRSYDEYVGAAALDALGAKRWSKRVVRVIEQIQPVLNPAAIFVGGRNAKRLKTDLPKHVHVVRDREGLTGGFRLWD